MTWRRRRREIVHARMFDDDNDDGDGYMIMVFKSR